MRCMTMGCATNATNNMAYTMHGDGVIMRDNVCRDCLESYRRRPVIRILAVGPVEEDFDIIAPGLG